MSLRTLIISLVNEKGPFFIAGKNMGSLYYTYAVSKDNLSDLQSFDRLSESTK